MIYLALLFFSMVAARMMRGCLKWVVLIGLLALVSIKDHQLANQIWDLLAQAAHATREWIINF